MSYGLVRGEGIVDLGSGAKSPAGSLKGLLRQGLTDFDPDAWERARVLPLKELQLAPVIPDPDRILCVGLNYETHRIETGRAKSDYPAIFTRFPSSQVGHGQGIVLPRVSRMLDYEGELAVVIGTAGRYIPAGEALDHVAGFSCYNDASVRDWQRHTHQFTPGKNFPRTGAFGPWLVTRDEVGELGDRTIETLLNGKRMQYASLSQMIFKVPEIIAYVSSFTPLAPGDVIATGTPGGVGFKREPPVWMKVGDRVEVDIEGIGRLENTIVGEAA